MTKNDKQERDTLRAIMNNNPTLKDFLIATTDKKQIKDLKKLVYPVLIDTFKKIRMQGIQTGWYAHAARCKDKIKDCKTIEEAIEILNEDVKMAQEKLGITPDE